MESKAAMELSRFAKPMVPSGMRFEHATFLGPGRVISSSSAASYRLHRPCWFRGREARCSSAKRETQVQILSEPLHLLRRWQNWLCTTLPRWTMRVQVPFFAHTPQFTWCGPSPEAEPSFIGLQIIK